MVIAAVGALIYSNSLSGQFQFDDGSSIVNNPYIHTLDIGRIWWMSTVRFVGYLTFALNYHFGGLDTTGYHAVNLVIHIVAACVLFCTADLLLKRAAEISASPLSPGASKFAALSAALIFVSHPIETQAVSYIVQRLASLTAMFYLLSIMLYTSGRMKMVISDGGAAWRLIASAAFAVLALFTKQNSFTLPFAIMLIEIAFFSTQPGSLKKKVWIFATLSLSALVIPIITFIAGGSSLDDLSELSRDTSLLSRRDYFLTQINVVRTYLRLLILPYGQRLDHSYFISRSIFELPTILSALLHIGILFAASLAYRRRRCVFFGIVFFYFALAVEAGPFPIRDLLVEHRLYLPSAGMFIAISCLMWEGIERFGIDRRIAWAALAALIALLGGLAHARNEVWKSPERLWDEVRRHEPYSWRAHYNLGKEYEAQKKFEDALAMYRRSIEIHPSAWPYNNIGNILLMQGKFDEAVQAYNNAIISDYVFAPAHANYAVTLEKAGNLDAAIEENKIALKFDPSFAAAHYNIGRILMVKGDIEGAESELRAALEIDPKHSLARLRLALIQNMRGKREKAIATLKSLLSDEPNNEKAKRALDAIERDAFPKN